MKTLTALKMLAIVFGVIIVVLLGVLFFYSPAKAPPQAPAAPGETMAPTTTPPAPIVSSDGTMSLSTGLLQSGALVASPLPIAGNVTGGGWFFEGTFPVKIEDAHGNVLGTTVARAQTDWTSTGTVPWTATLDFKAPSTATGTVIFQNDNPSGDPANLKTLSVPVRFK